MTSLKMLPDPIGVASGLCDDVSICKGVKDTVKSVTDPVINIIDFAKDPFGYIGSKLEQACEDLARKLFGALVSVLHPDFSVDWFIKAYEVSFALGIIIMGFLFLAELTAYRKGQRGTDEILDNVFTAVPMYFLGVLIGPFVGNLLCTMIGSLCDDLVNWGGGTGGMAGSSDMLTQLIILSTPDAMLGGTIVSIIIFFFMIIAFFCLAIGMITMLVTLYMSGVTFPIGWAWIVRNRDKQIAYKVINVFLGITFSQPIVFFMLGFVNRMLKANLFGDGNTGGIVTRFFSLLAAILALFMVALSPWAATKFSPIGTRAGGPSASDLKRMANNFGGGRKSSGSDGQLGQVSRMQSTGEVAGAGEGLGGLGGGVGEGAAAGAGEGAAAGAAGVATGGAAVAAAVAAKAAQKAGEAADEASDVASPEGEENQESEDSDEAQGPGDDNGALSDAASSQAESDGDSAGVDGAAANAQTSQEESATPGTDGAEESDLSGSALGEQAQKESEGDQEARGGHDGAGGREGSALTDTVLVEETGSANPGGKGTGGSSTTGSELGDVHGGSGAAADAEGRAGTSDSEKSTGSKPATSGLGDVASSEVTGSGSAQSTDCGDDSRSGRESLSSDIGSGLGDVAADLNEGDGTAQHTSGGGQEGDRDDVPPSSAASGLGDMAATEVTSGHGGHAPNTDDGGEGVSPDAGSSLGVVAAAETAAGLSDGSQTAGGDAVSSDGGHGLGDVASSAVNGEGDEGGGHATSTNGGGGDQNASGDGAGNPFLASMVEPSVSEPAHTTSASTGQAGASSGETDGRTQGSYAAIGSDPSYASMGPNPNPSRTARVISGVNPLIPGRNRGNTITPGTKQRQGWASRMTSAVKNPAPGTPSRVFNSLSSLSAFMDAQTTSHLRAGDRRGE